MWLDAAALSRLSRLLDQAMDLSPAERERWLAALPAPDRALEAELRQMLSWRGAADEAAFLARAPRLDAAGGEMAARARPGSAGRRSTGRRIRSGLFIVAGVTLLIAIVVATGQW